ncbi:MAG: alpha-ketoacid dehydrogenase subunit beta [Rhodospirillales bacterium]|nr:alpha-ketoacid dehydrogenase subunit beta [Rhodospirillales bacterium]
MPETRQLSYGEAIYEATLQEMERDPSVFVYGLGVDDPKGHYGTTKDFHERFGPDRCFDTPLSEDTMTGLGVGAALMGMRPIHVHQRMDFLLLCMNQLINMAAKYHYVSAGQWSVPMVVRASIGRSWGQGPQHSQALQSMFAHVPGLKVVAPTTPYDAKGCFIEAIRDNNPVIFIEHRLLYANKGHVPEESYTVPFGKARVLKEGDDVTLVATTHMVVEALRAREQLKTIGIDAEVIDLVSLSPIDTETVSKSVNKTDALVVVDNGWENCGISAEVIAKVAELNPTNFPKFARMGFAPVTCPTTKVLENEFYPNSTSIAQKVNRLLNEDQGNSWNPVPMKATEIEAFKGPF